MTAENVSRCFQTAGGDFFALKKINLEIPRGKLRAVSFSRTGISENWMRKPGQSSGAMRSGLCSSQSPLFR